LLSTTTGSFQSHPHLRWGKLYTLLGLLCFFCQYFIWDIICHTKTSITCLVCNKRVIVNASRRSSVVHERQRYLLLTCHTCTLFTTSDGHHWRHASKQKPGPTPHAYRRHATGLKIVLPYCIRGVFATRRYTNGRVYFALLYDTAV